jgi:cytochrome c-type biogenesis protein CcmH/NrfF
VLVAYGVRALRPLAAGYTSAKLKGLATIVERSGTVRTLASAPPVPAFEKRALAWKAPAAILVLGVLVLLGFRLRKVHRCLEQLPPPAPTDPLQDAEIRAQLDEWERLAAHDGNGAKRHDDATQRP